MGYDASLLARCLDALSAVPCPPVRHKNVFGMRGLLVGRRMFAAVGRDGLVVRVPTADYTRVVRRPGVRPFKPGGERLGRWEQLDAAVVADDPELREWLQVGLLSLGE